MNKSLDLEKIANSKILSCKKLTEHLSELCVYVRNTGIVFVKTNGRIYFDKDRLSTIGSSYTSLYFPFTRQSIEVVGGDIRPDGSVPCGTVENNGNFVFDTTGQGLNLNKFVPLLPG